MPANWNNTLHWNIVDVRGADRLLHYGRVIDCSEEGLMTDFGDGKAPHPVPFGQIYCCTRKELSYKVYQMTESCPVNVGVLSRLQRDQPAKWYQGVMLTMDFEPRGSFALVRITTPDGTSTLAVVPGNRLRSGEGLGQLLVEKGQFVKEEFDLPSGVASGLPSPSPYKTPPADQHLVDRFNSNCSRLWMAATHIDGGVLHVLRISDLLRRNYDDCRKIRNGSAKLKLETIFRTMGMTVQTQRKHPNHDDATTKRVLSLACSTPSGAPSKLQSSASAGAGIAPSARRCAGSSASTPVRQPIPAAAALSPEASSTLIYATAGLEASSTQSLRDLPKHVLAEIFECLDGVTQTRLRRVYSRWNDILTSLYMSRLFRMPEDSRLCEPISAHLCLLKRWTPQTKIIVYSAGASIGVSDADVVDSFAEEHHCGTLLCTGRFFRCIFQEKQLPRLDILVLNTIAWEWSGHPEQHSFSNSVEHIRTELNCFASVCHRLVVREVIVPLSGRKIPIVVRLSNTRMEGSVSADTLWHLLDQSQPPLSHADLACWAESINGNLHRDSTRQFIEILNDIQSADPRDNNRFRGKEWTSDDLANLDLKKLNRITSHSLVKACCYKKTVCSTRKK